MKSIKQIRQDVRVYEVEINSSYDPDYPDTNSKYLVNLKDGYIFDDGTHVAGANTVKELNELLKGIEEEKQ